MDHLHDLPQLRLPPPDLAVLVVVGGDGLGYHGAARRLPLGLGMVEDRRLDITSGDSLSHELDDSGAKALAMALLKEVLCWFGCPLVVKVVKVEKGNSSRTAYLGGHGQNGLVTRYKLRYAVREWLQLVLHELERLRKVRHLLLGPQVVLCSILYVMLCCDEKVWCGGVVRSRLGVG